MALSLSIAQQPLAFCRSWLLQRSRHCSSLPPSTILTGREETQGIRKGFCPPMATMSYQDSRGSELFIGLRALEKARSTLEDFCRSYFMFHDKDVTNPDHIFRYQPILYFTEAVIYQLDEENEAKLQPPPSTVSSSDEQNEADPFKGLRQVFISKGLMTEKIEVEFKKGVEYWRLERKLTESLKLGEPVTKEEVFRTMMLRSSDYRILYHLLSSLSHRMVDEDHLEFLSVAELLGEVADDLFDYKEDVLENTFNVLRMLVYTYGPTQGRTILEEFLSAQERRYQELLENLEPGLRKRFQRRCEEGRGASMYGNLGSWTIPQLILDEDAFRNQVRCNSITVCA